MNTTTLWVIVIAVILLVPFALVWMLNTLFGTGLDYTLKTWLAALILGALFSGNQRK
jgi:hypothetical protein